MFFYPPLSVDKVHALQGQILEHATILSTHWIKQMCMTRYVYHVLNLILPHMGWLFLKFTRNKTALYMFGWSVLLVQYGANKRAPIYYDLDYRKLVIIESTIDCNRIDKTLIFSKAINVIYITSCTRASIFPTYKNKNICVLYKLCS